MQEFTDGRFAARIAARNSTEHVRTRLTLRFSLCYFIMFVAGMLLWRYTSVSTLPALTSHIDGLFTDPFAGCALAREMIRKVLRAARWDVLALGLIAVSGMTYFSTAASDAILIVAAIRFGTCVSGSIGAILGGTVGMAHGRLAFFVYFFAQLCIAGILLAMAADAVIFSYDYRDACRSLRSGRDGLAVAYFLRTVSLIGALILVHTAYAMLLHALR